MDRRVGLYRRGVIYGSLAAGLSLTIAGCGTTTVTQPPGGGGPRQNTSLVLAASPVPAAVGSSFTLTATITPSSAVGGFNFSNPQGSVGQVVEATGTASVQTTPLQLGTILYTAAFDPTSQYASSTNTLNVPVRMAPSTSSCGLGNSVYVLNSGSQTVTNGTYTADTSNQSAACAQGSGTALTLVSPAIHKTGDGLLFDDPSGINSAVLAYGPGSSVTTQGGTITTSGIGAYGAFASGVNASVDVNGTVIQDDVSGVGAAAGGTVTLTDATVGTATDVVVSVNGSSSVTATDSKVASSLGTGGVELDGVITFYDNLLPGDAAGTGQFTMVGGSLTAGDGAVVALYGTASANVSLTKVVVTSGPLFFSSISPNSATVTISGSTIQGNFEIQNDGVQASLSLKDGSSFVGTIYGGAVTLDASSKWTLPAGTTGMMVGLLTDPDGISGSSVTNIVGNGTDVTYDPKVNTALNGKTCSLVGGGQLKPIS